MRCQGNAIVKAKIESVNYMTKILILRFCFNIYIVRVISILHGLAQLHLFRCSPHTFRSVISGLSCRVILARVITNTFYHLQVGFSDGNGATYSILPDTDATQSFDFSNYYLDHS